MEVIWVWIEKFMKFKTPTEKLNVVLIGVIFVLGIVSYQLYNTERERVAIEEKKRLEERAYCDQKMKEERAASAKELAESRKETADARKGITDCETESLAFAKELLSEQKQANSKSKKITRTQTKEAVQTRQLTNQVGEQQKQLNEKFKE